MLMSQSESSYPWVNWDLVTTLAWLHPRRVQRLSAVNTMVQLLLWARLVPLLVPTSFRYLFLPSAERDLSQLLVRLFKTMLRPKHDQVKIHSSSALPCVFSAPPLHSSCYRTLVRTRSQRRISISGITWRLMGGTLASWASKAMKVEPCHLLDSKTRLRFIDHS
jgi:hypothetical protein